MRHLPSFALPLALPLALALSLAAAPIGAARADGMAMDGQHHTGADKDFAAGMASMSQHMDAVKATGDTDRDFVAMMLPHHQGAVDMARVELAHGKDPALRRMAAAIVASQEKEIAVMKAWQARHGQ